jgi:hypothetical protein
VNGKVKESGAAQSAAAPQSRFVSEIDGLRCLAMTAFVLRHCELLPFGWTGV